MKNSRIHPLAMVLAFALLCVAMPGAAVAAYMKVPTASPRLDADGFVVALDAPTREYITSNAARLHEACGVQIAVAAVRLPQEADIAGYASEMFDYYLDVGDAEPENGVLLLLDVAADDFWCFIGSDIGPKFSGDDIRNSLSQALEPHFAVGDYNAAARELFAWWFSSLDEHYSAGLGGASSLPISDEQIAQLTQPLASSFVGIDALLVQLDDSLSAHPHIGRAYAAAQPGSTRIIVYGGIAIAVPASSRNVTLHGTAYVRMASGGYLWLDSINGVNSADTDRLADSVIAGIAESGANVTRRGPLVINRTLLREVAYTSNNLEGETYMLVSAGRFIIINFARTGEISDEFENEIIDCIYSLTGAAGS